MKKFLCTAIAVSMILSSVSVFAKDSETAAAAEIAIADTVTPTASADNSEQMKTALAAVKQRVDIPAEYTEFAVSESNFGYYDDYSYVFTWSEKNGNNSIEVYADADGNIASYAHYIDSGSTSRTNIAKNSKEEVSEIAETALKKLMPSAFENSDTLEQTEFEYCMYTNEYSLSYERRFHNVEVRGQGMTVSVQYDANGEMYVSDVTMDYDYNAEFNAPSAEVTDLKAAYKELTMPKLIYSLDYDWNNGVQTKSVNLKYELDSKYMSTADGSEVEMYYHSYRYARGGANIATAEAADSGDVEFTDEETKKLEENASLKTPDEIAEILKGAEVFGISDDATVESYRVYYEDTCNRYTTRIYLSDGTTASVNSQTGEIYSVHSYTTDDSTDASETEESAKAKTDAFLNKYVPHIGEYKLESTDTEDGVLESVYCRYVNDICCNFDNMVVSYDLNAGRITYYYADYTDGLTFPKSDGVITADKAFDIMYDNGDFEVSYIPVSEHEYTKCATLLSAFDIDAFTGKSGYESSDDWTYEHSAYTDIDGHWCETAARGLENSGIAFNGSLLKPDEPITQWDLLRLVSAVKNRGYALKCSPSELNGMVTDMSPFYEDTPESPVTRESACVYFAKVLDIYDYATDGDMFKTVFDDADEISEDKIGSVALLASAGIVGKNGNFRPKDNITYAEAVTILYNIFIKNQ